MLDHSSTLSILMAASSFPEDLNDWKSVFIRHLAVAMHARGDTDLHIWAPRGQSEVELQWVMSTQDTSFLQDLMSAGGIANLLRNRPVRGVIAALRMLRGLNRSCRDGNHAAYHINWLQNALALPDDGKPALITALGSDMSLLRLPLVIPLLRRQLHRRNAIICPNAQWMVEPLAEVFGDLAEIRFVPFGIDPIWFKVERQLPPDTHHWLVVSRLTNAKLGPLFETCQQAFSSSKRQLHLIGPKQEDIDIPSWVHYHGPMPPERLASEWFPQATGLITLSQHAEGRPQVMLEAMAAGVPIVASNIQAHSNFIAHGKTGWLTHPRDELEEAIKALEEPETNQAVAAAARSWAIEEVGAWDDCALRFRSLLEQIR